MGCGSEVLLGSDLGSFLGCVSGGAFGTYVSIHPYVAREYSIWGISGGCPDGVINGVLSGVHSGYLVYGVLDRAGFRAI